MASKSDKNSCPVDICVVLDNIRSLHNVGAIFRTCDGAGVNKVYLCGMTGTPPRREITKTAIGAEDTIEWEYRRYTLRLIKKLKAEGYTICSLEKNDKSKVYNSVDYPKKVCLVVGHEIKGVNPKVLELSDHVVHIPMRGNKESLNVATAFGISIYQMTNQIFPC